MNYIFFKRQTSKKFILSLAIFSLVTVQTGLYALQPHLKKMKLKITKFTADNAFGGIDAQASYKKKDKAAAIIDGATKYTFNTIHEDPNPILNPNKLNLVHLGFFSDHTNRADMPVITHIFGNPTNENAKRVARTMKNIPKENEPANQDSNVVDDSIVIFKPAKQFDGHDLLGNYSIITHTATINDPSGQNKKSYAFENVQTQNSFILATQDDELAQKPILIGSYTPAPQCSNGTPKVCSHVMTVINLYGYLKA